MGDWWTLISPSDAWWGAGIFCLVLIYLKQSAGFVAGGVREEDGQFRAAVKTTTRAACASLLSTHGRMSLGCTIC